MFLLVIGLGKLEKFWGNTSLQLASASTASRVSLEI